MMPRIVFQMIVLLLLVPANAQSLPDSLLTVAERSDFQATATSAEVETLMVAIADASAIVHLDSLGSSFNGLDIPMAIIANPPLQAPPADDDDRLVVLAFGNIHAGEVCGKEALLMLMREWALSPEDMIFEDIILLVAPNYNPDGNDVMALDNRPGQIGPAEGMGQRPNAQGFDLNRDYVKLESPEARGMVDVLNRWDPDLIIDTHTTNGSRHRYALTYEVPLNPSGHPAPIDYLRQEL
ncbi:MAG: M14 family zinc carboxypeptidase, partial [Planctomycetota bacterium]